MGKSVFLSENEKVKLVVPTPTLTPSLTTFPTPTPTHLTPTPNPDPVVQCRISPKCGGGTKNLNKSVCRQARCCQIAGGWYLFDSESNCRLAQNNYNEELKRVNYQLSQQMIWQFIGYQQGRLQTIWGNDKL